MEHLSNNHEDHPNQHENSHKLSNKTGHPIVNLMESLETETTGSEFPNGGKAILEQILASEEINKSKRAGLWVSRSWIRVGKLTISVRSFNRVDQLYRFHQNRLASPYDGR